MNFILTAAAATTAGAAIAAGGPAVWIGTAVVVALSIAGGIMLKNSKDQREREQAEKILEESNKIAQEQGVANTDNSIPKEEENAWTKPANPSLVSALTGQTEQVTANDRAAISKGNIIDNYMNGEKAETQSQAAAPGVTSGVIGYFDKNQFYNSPKEESKPNEKPIETPIGPEGEITEDDETSIAPPPGITNTPVIGDKTEENLEQEIPNTVDNEWERWYKLREEQWAREDAIRKETQEREDTAYQRAIADMKKAGLNPNLYGVTPAESGGGITQASMPDMGAITNQMNIDLKELQQLIDQNFQGNENDMNRLKDTFTSILSAIAMIVAFKK